MGKFIFRINGQKLKKRRKESENKKKRGEKEQRHLNSTLSMQVRS
jgi:hypothetical protein